MWLPCFRTVVVKNRPFVQIGLMTPFSGQQTRVEKHLGMD